ncbi:MAG: signal peptidase II [Alphaproteobacteria bacterium]|nr:signal peptidase II [Alphaproteobacteria bacterium]
MNYRYIRIGAYLAAIVVLVDQFSKWWIVERVMVPPQVVEINPLLNFALSWNRGVTFGLLNQGSPWAQYVFTGLAAVILCMLASWLWKTTSTLIAMALALVMGGAVGNVIDRLRFGAVVDFIDFHIADYHWYVFNLADSAIVCGVGLLLIDHLVNKPEKS